MKPNNSCARDNIPKNACNALAGHVNVSARKKLRRLIWLELPPPPPGINLVSSTSGKFKIGSLNSGEIQSALDGLQPSRDVLIAGLRPQDLLRHTPDRSFRLIQGQMIDIDRRNAPGEDVRGWNWKQIDSAVGANFARSNFNGVHFAPTKSSGFNFSQATLDNASFINAKFPHATKFEQAELRNADLRGARLREADFTGANLTNAIFISTKVAGKQDTPADLRRALFRRTDLTGADFTGARLTGANFQSATGSSVTDRNELLTAGTKLDKADLRGARFYKQDMSFFSLNGADLRGADLETATNVNSIRNATGVIYSGPDSKYPTKFPPGFTPPASWIMRRLDNYNSNGGSL
jgi:uncharacterized protein YjbI with pentapeptide repeats